MKIIKGIKPIWVAIAFIAIIILVVNAIFAFGVFSFDKTSGSFGDAWGLSSSLFSLVSLLLIVYSIGEQGEQIKIQSFESSLMSLLNNHKSLLAFSRLPNNETDVFKNFYSKVDVDSIESIIKVYEEEIKLDYGHYFSNIYRILKFIDIRINPKKKSHYSNDYDEKSYHYTSIFRSQLNIYELFWLQAYIFSIKDEKYKGKCKRQIEKSSFLKPLTVSENHYKVFEKKKNFLMKQAYYPIDLGED